jgi:hypothetical protein
MAKGIVEDGDAVGCLERGRQKEEWKKRPQAFEKFEKASWSTPDRSWIAKSSRLRR